MRSSHKTLNIWSDQETWEVGGIIIPNISWICTSSNLDAVPGLESERRRSRERVTVQFVLAHRICVQVYLGDRVNFQITRYPVNIRIQGLRNCGWEPVDPRYTCREDSSDQVVVPTIVEQDFGEPDVGGPSKIFINSGKCRWACIRKVITINREVLLDMFGMHL